LQVEIFHADISPIAAQVILAYRFIETELVCKIGWSRLRAQTYKKAVELSVSEKIFKTVTEMSSDLWISQTEHSPLPPLSAAIYQGILRVFPAETGLPTYVVVVLFAMITDLADSFGRERPTLVEQRNIKVCFHSHLMGKLRYNLEKTPAEATVLGSKGMLKSLGSIVVTLDACSNNSPMNYCSA